MWARPATGAGPGCCCGVRLADGPAGGAGHALREESSRLGEERLAAVVVNTNAGEDVLRCVRSVYESAGDAAFHVVLSDNGSTDGSVEAVLSALIRTFRLIQRSNRPPGTFEPVMGATSAPFATK